MAVFVFHAANHLRHFVVGAERRGPVGDGQAGIIAGNERSGDDEDERGAGGEDCEAVQSAMVRNFDALQDCPHWKLATWNRPLRFQKQRSLSDRRAVLGVAGRYEGLLLNFLFIVNNYW